MEARNERIDQLAERWLTAQATEEEERTLRELVRKGAALPEAFDDLGMLFEGFDDLAAETLPTERRIALPARRPLQRIVLSGLAAAAAIAGGVFSWQQHREPYCYVAGTAIY
ncbi:MAG: hypothetical protein K2I59_08360, partial [Alistipes sp.]|nr:hypothetical protein [Alistipes sp.]